MVLLLINKRHPGAAYISNFIMTFSSRTMEEYLAYMDLSKSTLSYIFLVKEEKSQKLAKCLLAWPLGKKG